MRMIEPISKKITIQERILFDRKENYVSLASLVAFEDLYLDNIEFFNAIMH